MKDHKDNEHLNDVTNTNNEQEKNKYFTNQDDQKSSCDDKSCNDKKCHCGCDNCQCNDKSSDESDNNKNCECNCDDCHCNGKPEGNCCN